MSSSVLVAIIYARNIIRYQEACVVKSVHISSKVPRRYCIRSGRHMQNNVVPQRSFKDVRLS